MAVLFVAVCLMGCGQQGDGRSTGAYTVGVPSVSDQPTGSASVAAVPLESTAVPTEVADTSTTQPPPSTSPIVATSAPRHDGQLHAEPAASPLRFVCAAVTLDGASTRFCSPASAFTWSIGNRVFIFSAGPTLQLRDGRFINAQPGTKYVIHEIVDESVDNPQHREPNFCSLILIAEAFRRFDPSSSYGWGGESCMSDDIFGVGTVPGVDQAGFSRVFGGPDGTDEYIGFVARLNGIWTVLELAPYDNFRGCAGLADSTAKELCMRSPSFKDYATE